MKSPLRFLLFLSLVSLSLISCSKPKSQKPNILFISVDDLRPQLGSYGLDYMKTPHLDDLAGEGTLFKNHFTQVPTCGASRYSMLTGLYPTKPGHLSNNAIVNEISNATAAASPETFIHHFKNNGYYTAGIGKISHSADGYVYGYNEAVSNQRELPQSWDTLYFNSGAWKTGWKAFFAYANGESRQSQNKKVKPYQHAQVEDTGYPDGLTAELAVEKLSVLKERKEPFFMGVGFFKPHLPFNAPKKYWDMYEEENLPLAPVINAPENLTPAALNNSNEFNHGYLNAEEHPAANNPVSDAYARRLRHAYFAAVSYIDAQIGMVLDELKRLELDKNTIVVVWGDHGWHLGDQSIWGKHALFDRSLKSILIIKTPGAQATNKKAEGIVESVDLYPTLCELSGIPVPKNLDGTNLGPMLNDASKEVKKAAHGFWHNGTTVRTKEYRLMRFPKQKDSAEYGLFDHRKNANEAVDISNSNPEKVKELETLLKDFSNN